MVAVITGQELVEAGLKPIPAAAPFKWKDGSDQRLAQRLSLAHEVVRHVGEPVALFVAETAAQAQDAADALVIDYEDLPAVMTAEQAMAPGAPQLHPGAPGNLVLDFVGGDEVATNAAFARAAKVVKLTAHHSRVIGNPMERARPQGRTTPPRTCISCTPPRRARVPCAGSSQSSACRPKGSGRRRGSLRRLRRALQCLSGIRRAPLRGEEARAPGEMGRHTLRSIPRRRAGARYSSQRRTGV